MIQNHKSNKDLNIKNKDKNKTAELILTKLNEKLIGIYKILLFRI
jgi:hypothetical protein